MNLVSVEHVTKIYNQKSLLGYIKGDRAINTDIELLKAVDDVGFIVKRGEAFGIIGRNGSGKSTLLQIIAGTLIPTHGFIKVNGRVSALLELGSGFNPEFTGIENVFLAGSILGISEIEMQQKLNDIINFADIGDAIYNSVKTYSTGMLMRVAFSVSISVEPDLLIIDEALSVGDILFQQKCNARLKELLSKGVALLVVTHDTGFVLNICNRALWIDKGKTQFLGTASECVNRYLAAMARVNFNDITQTSITNDIISVPNVSALSLITCTRSGIDDVYINRAWIFNECKQSSTLFNIGEWCEVIVEIKSNKDLFNISTGCELRDRHGQVIFATGLRVIRKLIAYLRAEETRLVSIRFQLNIAPGQYTLDLGCGAGHNDTNVGYRLIGCSILEVKSEPSDDIVHGIVKLPYEIKVSNS